MLKYRELFYKQYYSSQLGRDAGVDNKAKLESESGQFEEEILPLLPRGNYKTLDIGCGIGSLVFLMKKKGYDAMGIDVSEEMVNVAHGLGIKEVIKDDLLPYLENNSNTFDIITGIDIIEHFTKDELVQLLLLVKDALKPGGTALFRTPNLDAPFATIFANGDFTHENYMNSSSAKQVMMNCGFRNISVLPSLIKIANPLKEIIRKILWSYKTFQMKLALFASGRSSKGVIFTPNMLIRVEK